MIWLIKRGRGMPEWQSSGLSSDIIDKLCSVFERFSQINSVILYGSRAKGTSKMGSDIDLTVVLNPSIKPTLNLRHQISMALGDLNLIYFIDLSLFEEIENGDLIEHIDRVGSTIYEKNN